MPIDTNWIEENILLHKLDRADQTLLDEVFEISRYQVGDEIVSQGHTGGGLHILRSGSASITQKNGKKCLLLGQADEGALFGAMSFLTENLASATVTAHSDCLTYKLNLDGYCTLLTKNQKLLLSLFTYMLSHSGEVLRKMNTQYAEQADSVRSA